MSGHHIVGIVGLLLIGWYLWQRRSGGASLRPLQSGRLIAGVVMIAVFLWQELR